METLMRLMLNADDARLAISWPSALTLMNRDRVAFQMHDCGKVGPWKP